jgi:hypothetical protein
MSLPKRLTKTAFFEAFEPSGLRKDLIMPPNFSKKKKLWGLVLLSVEPVDGSRVAVAGQRR